MKTKLLFAVFLTFVFIFNSNAQINIVNTTGNLAIGDITDPSVYKLWAKYGNVSLLGCGQNGYGSRLFKLQAGTVPYNCFSISSASLSSGSLVTILGVNFDVDGGNGIYQYATYGNKYAPKIELNADSGSIILFGENGPLSGTNYRAPSGHMGVYVKKNGWVGINSNNNPTCALDIIGSVKVSSSSNLIGYVNINNPPSPTCPLEVSGTGKADAWTTRSDARLKENIINLKNPIDSLFLLQGVSYNLKWPVVQKTFSPSLPGSSKTDSINNNQSGNDNNTSSVKVDSALYSRRHIGFIAQDVQKIFPDLVYGDKDGILSMDYISIIPMLVEGLKQQQQIITAQSSKIKELDTRLTKVENGNTQNGTIKSGSTVSEPTSLLSIAAANALLYQNIPNPFSIQTEIKYYIPESATNGSLLIFNMQGTLIKSLLISAFGNGSQTISGSELKPGMYMYTLIVDSKEVDTKRMILTE